MNGVEPNELVVKLLIVLKECTKDAAQHVTGWTWKH